ncbi:MAG: ATP synthase subunit C [Ruthenibacterium sp.]
MKQKNTKKLVRTLLVVALMAATSLVLAAFSFAEGAPASAAVSVGGNNVGIGLLAAALSVGVAGIGAGIAVGAGAPAAIGALTEDAKTFGKSLIFVALGEGIALYGMLVSILILAKI